MAMVLRVDKGDHCEYSGCTKDAVDLVYSTRYLKVLKLCDYHGDLVVEESDPEYTDQCENCGCYQGVN